MTIVRSNPPKRTRSRPKPATAVTPAPARIVTARRPNANRTDVLDLSPEEHQRRGDAADELFREIVREISREDG